MQIVDATHQNLTLSKNSTSLWPNQIVFPTHGRDSEELKKSLSLTHGPNEMDLPTS